MFFLIKSGINLSFIPEKKATIKRANTLSLANPKAISALAHIGTSAPKTIPKNTLVAPWKANKPPELNGSGLTSELLCKIETVAPIIPANEQRITVLDISFDVEEHKKAMKNKTHAKKATEMDISK